MTRSYNADRIRRRLSLFTIDTLFRLIHERHAGTPLGVAVAPSRFSDPKGKYAVLYAAGTVPCALWEGLVRNRLARRQRREIPKQEVKETRVVSLTASEPLALVDLRDDGPVRIGAPTAVAHDSNHAAGRALSAATHGLVPESDGFLFQSRFTGHNCLALFDRAIVKLEALDVEPLMLRPEFADALTEYEITLRDRP